MKGEELEKLYNVSAKMKKGIEHIKTGRVDVGRAWIEEAARSLNILITMTELENDKKSGYNKR